MKVRKISALITSCTVLLVGMMTLPVHAEEMIALPQTVIDLANGSDAIIGEGAPIVHAENEDARFSSGGVDHTHQYIVSSALVILNNDKGQSKLNTYAESLCAYTDWPDVFGNETDYGTFSGHFYDPDTGKNWMGQTSPTARTRAEVYFDSAVAAYKDGYTSKAMEYLGKGTHYVSDLNEPHHASNLTAVNSNHFDFEKYVDEHRTEYKINGNTFDMAVYQAAEQDMVGNMMYTAAKSAKNLVGQAQEKATYSSAGNASVQNAIQTVTKYVYKFAVEVGIY